MPTRERRRKRRRTRRKRANTRNDLMVTQCETTMRSSGRGSWKQIVVLGEEFGKRVLVLPPGNKDWQQQK